MTSTKKIKAIEIRAEVRQLKTMADGSVNLILNLPEDCIEQSKVLLGWMGLEVKAAGYADRAMSRIECFVRLLAYLLFCLGVLR